jgi:hypothetical protein
MPGEEKEPHAGTLTRLPPSPPAEERAPPRRMHRPWWIRAHCRPEENQQGDYAWRNSELYWLMTTG